MIKTFLLQLCCQLSLNIKNKTASQRSFSSAEGEIWTPDQGLMSPLLYH